MLGFCTSLALFKFTAFSLGSFTASFIDSMWVLPFALCRCFSKGQIHCPLKCPVPPVWAQQGRFLLPVNCASHLTQGQHPSLPLHNPWSLVSVLWFPSMTVTFSFRRLDAVLTRISHGNHKSCAHVWKKDSRVYVLHVFTLVLSTWSLTGCFTGFSFLGITKESDS